ncbi:hypothetical protein D3C77_534770 [compost metagenome]
MQVALILSFCATLRTLVTFELSVRFRIPLSFAFGLRPVDDVLLATLEDCTSVGIFITVIRRDLTQDLDHIEDLLHTKASIFSLLLRYDGQGLETRFGFYPAILNRVWVVKDPDVFSFKVVRALQPL